MPNEKAPLPLEGIKVIELATVVAAPTVGRMLAAYGAEVIKIESPPVGDQQRRAGKMHQIPAEDYNNPEFDVFNSGKKKIALNLKSNDGIAALHKMLADTDVFLSNVRMDALGRLGLSYETLKERYPRLIYAHLSGYGLKGPNAKKPGYYHTTFWQTGPLVDWPVKGDFPLRPTYGFGDEVTASNLTAGILMAILSREKSGHGTMVTISLYGTGVWCNASFVMASQPQFAMELPWKKYSFNPFVTWFQCADGKWIYILGKYDYERDKEIYAKLFNIPELLTDPRAESLATLAQYNAFEEYYLKVGKAVKLHTSEEWQKLLDSCDVAYSMEYHFADVCQDPQAWENEYLEKIEYPCGTVAMPKIPIKFSEYGEREFQISGGIGEDTDEVLQSYGYSLAEIEKMRADKAVL